MIDQYNILSKKFADIKNHHLKNEAIELYRAVGSVEYDYIRASQYLKMSDTLPSNQKSICLSKIEDNSIGLAREWFAKDPNYGNLGIVIKLKIKKSFLELFQKSDYDQQYNLSYVYIKQLNENIVGEIETVKIFSNRQEQK